MPLDRLTPHPMNPNQGDVGLLTELLDANGFAGAVMVQESTGIIIDGETRWRAAAANGMKALPVMWADVDDDTRDRLLASINESNRRGVNDQEKLLALLQPFTVSARGLAGTAFDGDDVDHLISLLSKPLTLGAGAADIDGGYAESEQELAEREQRYGNYADRKQGGDLVEMILVFTVPQREEAAELLRTARNVAYGGDARAADIMLRGLKVLAEVLSADDPDMGARARELAGQPLRPEGTTGG